jgi:uncharacterized protein YhfF
MGTVLLSLLKPDGSALTNTSSSSAAFNMATQTLPTSGTYKVVVNPTSTSVGTISVAVTNP